MEIGMSYFRDGMGLHDTQIKSLKRIIKENNVKQVVEFGSGASTQFFIDFHGETDGYQITSFDHDPQYMFAKKHDALTLNLKQLIECTDERYESMFESKTYDRSNFTDVPASDTRNFRAKNRFYDIEANLLPDKIDLVLLDGPNGNGRSISFLHLKDKLADTCHIMIDDSDHYDFVDRCQSVLGGSVIELVIDPRIHPLFSYAIIRIEK